MAFWTCDMWFDGDPRVWRVGEALGLDDPELAVVALVKIFTRAAHYCPSGDLSELGTDEDIDFIVSHWGGARFNGTRWIGRAVTAEILRDAGWLTEKNRLTDWTLTPPETRRRRRPRKNLSTRTRFEVMERDGFACRYCGARDVTLHIDHARSKADGGGDDITNLVTACADCNLGKGRRSVEAHRGA
jgi:5-methylcytosine-specific restriction endonuclease McrA